MNERIRELAKQATKEVWGTNPFNGSPEFEGYELDQEKFAELVIEDLVASMRVENSDLYHNEENNWGCISVKFWVEGDPSAMRGEQIQSRFADGSVRGTGSYRLNHEFVRHLMSKHFGNKE